MSEFERYDREPRSATQRVLGGSALGVLIRLAIMSFVVGLILRALRITPNDIIAWIEERVLYLSSLSFDTLEEVAGIFVLGAAIVIPVWLLMRVLRLMSR